MDVNNLEMKAQAARERVKASVAELPVLVVLDGNPGLRHVEKVVTAYGELTAADLNRLAFERWLEAS